MSQRLPALSGADVLPAPAQAGFAEASQRGSHVKLRHGDGRTAIAPLHRELAPGTLGSVLRQTRLPRGDFRDLL